MIDPKNLPGTATLMFADEFNLLELWNGTRGWATKYPFAPEHGSTLDGNSEQEWYINHAYAPTAHIKPWSVSGGILTLKAEKAATPILTGPLQPYLYTSGMISSFHSFWQQYGYFEMRAQFPKGQGFWPAFWLLPLSMAWPPEIDVVEVLGHDMTGLWTTVHSKMTTPVNNGIRTTVPDMSLDFHTYGVDWQQVFPIASPNARAFYGMAFDERRGFDVARSRPARHHRTGRDRGRPGPRGQLESRQRGNRGAHHRAGGRGAGRAPRPRGGRHALVDRI